MLTKKYQFWKLWFFSEKYIFFKFLKIEYFFCKDFTQNFTLIMNLSLFLGLLNYFGRYMPCNDQNPKNAVFRRIFTMVTVFFGPNQLVLVKVTHGRYGAGMLGYVPVPRRNGKNCCTSNWDNKLVIIQERCYLKNIYS